MEKLEKRQFQQISIIKINILAKFHQERMIFDEIRGHLLILPFYRALTRASEGNTILILTLHSNPDLDVSRGTRELLFDFEFNNGYSLEFEDSTYQPIEIGI